jgi:5-formyltetrahydrofolate cyclo-ligase
MILNKDELRKEIWEKLLLEAIRHPYFGYNFAEVIPNFRKSEEAVDRICTLAEWKSSQMMFLTPDEIWLLRMRAFRDLKSFVITPYGIRDEFRFVNPTEIPVAASHRFLATLDGIEGFPKVSMARIQQLAKIDVLVTGAFAVSSTNGVRWGKGHGYFDLEWAMLSEMNCLSENPVVICIVADCQVVDSDLPGTEYDTRVDLIVTPTRTISVPHGQGHRPGKLHHDLLTPLMIETMPPLQEVLAYLQAKEMSI